MRKPSHKLQHQLFFFLHRQVASPHIVHQQLFDFAAWIDLDHVLFNGECEDAGKHLQFAIDRGRRAIFPPPRYGRPALAFKPLDLNWRDFIKVHLAELADEHIDMADIGPPGSFVELRPRQVFLFDKRLKRGRRNLLVFLFIRVLANLSLGPFRLSLGSRFRDHSPIAPGFNHEVVMPTTSSFSYGHIAPFPSCSHGSEAVGYYRETSVMVERSESGGERRASDSLPWRSPVKDFFQKEDRATPGL